MYVEDQYLWSFDVARIFAAALRRAPRLSLIAVVPYRTDEKEQAEPAAIGQGAAMSMVRDAGGDRVQILEIENHERRPVYVHDKLCIIDDVWAVVGEQQPQQPVVDPRLRAGRRDFGRRPRFPRARRPAGLGDGARRFARSLRLDLMREHLDLSPADDVGLLDPDRAAATVRRQAAALDAWHADGCRGARPPGRLRRHSVSHEQERLSARHRWFTVPAYRVFLDPDGRPLGMKLRRTY